jgi:hypothetical protein
MGNIPYLLRKSSSGGSTWRFANNSTIIVIGYIAYRSPELIDTSLVGNIAAGVSSSVSLGMITIAITALIVRFRCYFNAPFENILISMVLVHNKYCLGGSSRSWKTYPREFTHEIELIYLMAPFYQAMPLQMR